MEKELLKLFEGEVKLTTKEENVFLWNNFADEEVNLTEKELEAWR